jgi:magnesium chelatase family protein
MPATARTFTLLGIEARPVRVEVDVSRGLSAFSLVGLPDAAVRESRERVRAALVNADFDFPKTRITANLAPADLRKGGPGLDLAIAAALLASSKQLTEGALDGVALAGELALDGSIRAIPGALAMAEAAKRDGVEVLAVPEANGPEAALVEGLRVVPMRHLQELRLLGSEDLPPEPQPLELGLNGHQVPALDLADLRGQSVLRRALEVAAAGGHNLLVVGPPGAGKSLAAHRLPSILPPLDEAEAVEVLRIASVCGRRVDASVSRRRPYRSPHHTISSAGLVGGGTPPRPGEITLAHRGVLFLDELAEFSRDAIEALREPLESGRVSIVRAGHAIELPCRFVLVGAANPCPCGPGPESDDCCCSDAQVRRYEARLSGALADRIDIFVRVERPGASEISAGEGESSAAVRERVAAARKRQAARLGPGRCNAEMTARETRGYSDLAADARELIQGGYERLKLSGRGYDRALRLARTIADLDDSEQVGTDHVAEALSLRRRGPA